MAWLHLTCHHYCRPTSLGGLYDLRVNISWWHLVIAWKVLASVVLRMPPLLFGIRSPSPSSVPSPLTFSRAIWRHICLISHIYNCDVTFLSYYAYLSSFCLVSVWYHKRFWAWRLVAVEIGAKENWHYYYYQYCNQGDCPIIAWKTQPHWWTRVLLENININYRQTSDMRRTSVGGKMLITQI